MAILHGHRQTQPAPLNRCVKKSCTVFPTVKHRHGKHRLLQNLAKAGELDSRSMMLRATEQPTLSNFAQAFPSS